MSHRRYVNPENTGKPALITPPQTNQPSPVLMNTTNTNSSSTIFPWGNSTISDPNYIKEQPPYFRTTTGYFPCNKDIMIASGIPYGLVVSPCQVSNVPVLDYSVSNIPRCTGCSAYLSPFTKALPDQTSFVCPFCGLNNTLARSLTDTIPLAQKAELMNHVYDLIAPPAFTSICDAGPAYAIIFDMSIVAISSGFTYQMISSVKTSFESMGNNVRVSLITMGNSISVFNFEKNSEITFSDLSDLFYLKGNVGYLGNVREMANMYLDSLLNFRPSEYSTGNCLGSALQVAKNTLLGKGGVIVAGFVGRPSIGPTMLKDREVKSDTTEKTLIHMPEDKTGICYKEIALEMNKEGVSCHIFCAPSIKSQVLDLAILSVPCGLTGGQCHYYSEINEYSQSTLHVDLFSTLTTDYYWDANLRLRTSKGITTKLIVGNLSTRQSTVSFPVLNPSSSVTFEVEINGDVPSGFALFQVALLWTSSNLKRMIRVFTFSLPLTNDVRQISSSINEAALFTLIAKSTAINVLRVGPSEAAMTFRKTVSQMANKSPFMSSFLYLSHSLLCSPLLRAVNPEGVDGRMKTIISYRSYSLIDMVLSLYPRLILVNSPPQVLPLASPSFAEGYCYVIHTISKILIWTNPSTPPEFLQAAFGVSNIQELPFTLPMLSTPENQIIQSIIQEAYTISRKYLPIEIIPPGHPRESLIGELLYDDSVISGSALPQFKLEMGY